MTCTCGQGDARADLHDDACPVFLAAFSPAVGTGRVPSRRGASRSVGYRCCLHCLTAPAHAVPEGGHVVTCSVPDCTGQHPATHTRTSTDAGPDYCYECSEDEQAWVVWPCASGEEVPAYRCNCGQEFPSHMARVAHAATCPVRSPSSDEVSL